MEDLFARLTSVNESDWEASDISSPSPSLTPTSGSPTSSLSPRSPKGSISGVPASSPRENSRFSAKLLAQKLVDNRDKLKSKFSSSEQVLGESLTPEQSQVLRLRVLDTLIKHQARVKELLSSNMNTMTQWMWLKV
jgi:hypothetical protein